MTTLHPHWQATDDAAPVPVRIAQSKATPTKIPAGTKSISRRPAAIVGILMAFSMGVVAYGTLDDEQAQISGETMGFNDPMPDFEALAEQMVRDSNTEAFDTSTDPEPYEEPLELWEASDVFEQPVEFPEESTQENVVYPQNFGSSIPVNPSTYDTAPTTLPASLPTNQNTIGANVTENFHSGAPEPPEQPQTGASMLWAIFLGAVAVMFWQSRGMLKARVV
ncbi:MAG: hypothetical protein Greene041662_865 [Candidatus Peregrinibacteria bacterium Greene0416_62]|nr:MAG: hypothetical protein Greene041662_865 [Candidatus Peregrinibacteria bacterium Greene0416_62]TSD00141.1 MAG: hypothetical protein Greene101449_302 [Candidatus Peregrinibacteria bacterium Greene1014_49]